MIVTGLLLALAAPSPPPLKEIIRVRASPVCSVLHDLIAPFAVVQRENQPWNAQLADNGRRLAIRLDEIRRLAGPFGPSPASDGTVILASANIDTAAANVLVNVASMDPALRASYRRTPQGRNAKVDALRQRVQNLVDLERALAFSESALSGSILDSNGDAEIASAASAFDRATQGASSAANGLTRTPDADPAIDGSPVQGIWSRDLHYTAGSSLAAAVAEQGRALVPAALAVAHDCDGT
ncbi:MAG: hypothetical protein M3Y18_00690 [Candidatus Eremiobacteraeota bacterium]|nr:hypothetical protein [Candidatus Eremiobacteraeota bacterium]